MIGNTEVYKEFMDDFLLTHMIHMEAWSSLLFPKKKQKETLEPRKTKGTTKFDLSLAAHGNPGDIGELGLRKSSCQVIVVETGNLLHLRIGEMVQNILLITYP